MNKYYEMFINEKIDATIFKVNTKSLSYEDYFWLFACMSVFYKNNKDYYMFKKSLAAACDLNYFYNALLYFEAFDVLPISYKKYIKNFEHKMKDDKIEALIAYANKIDKKQSGKNFLWYSLTSILVIPLMLILVFVFNFNTTIAAVASIIFLFVSQTFMSPMMKQRKETKNAKRDSELPKDIKAIFKFILIFQNLIYTEKYMALIASETDEERDIIVKCIKTNKPLPDEIKNKDKIKKKNKNNKK